jgi:hypothetical protein
MKKVFLLIVLFALAQVAFSAFSFSTTSLSGSNRFQYYECTHQCGESQKKLVILDLRSTELWSEDLSGKLKKKCERGCDCQKVAGILSMDFSKFKPILDSKCFSKKSGTNEDETKSNQRGHRNKGGKVLESEVESEIELEYLN